MIHTKGVLLRAKKESELEDSENMLGIPSKSKFSKEFKVKKLPFDRYREL